MVDINRSNMSKAETMRYTKIQNLIDLLQGNTNLAVIDSTLGDSLPAPFTIGRRIAVDETTIKIGKKSYSIHEIKNVTINTEGSMAVYGNNGKKLCGSLSINVSSDNIELFCVWVRRCNIPVEVLSGKRERIFQYVILLVSVIVAVFLKLLNNYI